MDGIFDASDTGVCTSEEGANEERGRCKYGIFVPLFEEQTLMSTRFSFMSPTNPKAITAMVHQYLLNPFDLYSQ